MPSDLERDVIDDATTLKRELKNLERVTAQSKIDSQNATQAMLLKASQQKVRSAKAKFRTTYDEYVKETKRAGKNPKPESYFL